MITATRPEMKERNAVEATPAQPTSLPYGSLDDLLAARTLRFRDVEVLGKIYRVRELKLGEADEIQFRTIKNELNGTGAVVGHADLRGTMALRVACGLMHQDGTPYVADPFKDYVKLLDLPADVLQPLDKAITELSAISEDAKAAVGKGSGRTGSSGS